MSTSDAQRGIQNAHERVAKLPSRTTVGDHYLDEKYNRQNGNNSDEEQAQEELMQEEIAMEEELRAEEEERARRQRIIQAKQILHGQAKKLASKHIFSGKNLGAKSTVRFLLGIALTIYVWQFVFAIISLVGYGIHAHVLYLRNQTIIGKVVGFFTEFQKWLPFENLGNAMWGLTTLLVFAEFVCFYIVFKVIGRNPMATSVSTLVTATSLALSMFPLTNIFPWLVLWVIYILLFVKTE